MLHTLGASLTRFGQWTRSLLVQDVPEEIAVCEFDCRKGECSHDEWERCERRLTKAAGELSPSSQRVLPPNS